jgi:hypothetical protein
MKLLYPQIILFLLLVSYSGGSGFGWAQSIERTEQSASPSGTFKANAEIHKVLFRHLLRTFLTDSNCGSSPRLVFLTTGASSAKVSSKPSSEVVESLADLNVTILDEAEFSWSDSLGLWLHTSTNRIGFQCHVDIVKWYSQNELEADVGFRYSEDSGQAYKVRLRRTKVGWTIRRTYDFRVY